MKAVQFKTNSTRRYKVVDSMTVFNTEKVDTKKQPMFFGAPLGVQRYDSYKYPAVSYTHLTLPTRLPV